MDSQLNFAFEEGPSYCELARNEVAARGSDTASATCEPLPGDVPSLEVSDNSNPKAEGVPKSIGAGALGFSAAEAAGPAAGRPLGIATKYLHAYKSGEDSTSTAISLEDDDEKAKKRSSEIATIVRLTSAYKKLPAPPSTTGLSLNAVSRLIRAERYCLQAAARHSVPTHRTAHCMHTAEGTLVPVHYSKYAKRASYSGLIVCGRVWTCPVCAARISEERRKDLTETIKRAQDEGLAVYMITRTFPHTSEESLLDIRKRLQAAENIYRNETWRRIKKHFGIVATVRALEITLGINGWHLHIHELIFVKGFLANDLHGGPEAYNSKLPADFEDYTMVDMLPRSLLGLRRAVYKHWSRTAIKAGLSLPSWANGVDISSAQGSYALAKYVNKWGLEHEVTKAVSKKSKRHNSLTPFDLLRIIAHSSDSGARAIAKRFFAEYADAMHGARQLVCAADKDYKFLFNPPLEDHALACMKPDDEDDTELLALLRLSAWKLIRNKHRAKLLEAIEASPTPQTILDYFADHFPTHPPNDILLDP